VSATSELYIVISTAAALTVVLGALWEIRKLARRLWNDTIGSRRKQQRILNGLFPSANIQYIEELLGYATLVSRSDSSGSVRRYRLPDCWVSAGVEKDAVNWISVTVTDPKFVFRTNQLTQGLLSIRLGRDCFDKIDSDWFQRRNGVGGSIGQREWSYVEYSDGPTAHRSQKMIVAHIRVGVGQLATEGDPMSPTFVRESTTVNSFAVGRPFADLLPNDVLPEFQEVQVVPLGRQRRIRRRLRTERSRLRRR